MKSIISYNRDYLDVININYPIADQKFFLTFDTAIQRASQSRYEAIVICGQFPRVLSPSMLLEDEKLFELSRGWTQQLRKLEMSVSKKPLVVIASGDLTDVGIELFLAGCHRIWIADTDNKLSFPAIKNFGIFPAHGTLQRLSRLLGIEQALQLLLVGGSKGLSPIDSQQLGITHYLATDEQDSWQKCRELLASKSEHCQPWDRSGFQWPRHPSSIEISKTWMVTPSMVFKKTHGHYPVFDIIASCIYEGSRLDFDSAIANDQSWWRYALKLPATRNILQVLAIDKQQLDRQAQTIDSEQPKQIGVIGAGMMGAGIAIISAVAGLRVMVHDNDKQCIQQLMARLKKFIDRRYDNQRQQEILARLEVVDDLEGFSDCQLVIEAVFEDRQLKKDIIERCDRIISSQAILASNTSTLPISSLAGYSRLPERVCGLHFFSPVERMPLVEIIRGQQSSVQTINSCLAYVAKVAKTPIVVNDGRGFYTSRVFMTYVSEGLTLLAAGHDPLAIERAGRLAGMPVAPLALIDEISLTLVAQIFRQTIADGEQIPEATRQVIDTMIDKSRSGRKYGQGFYDYPTKRLWSGLNQLFPTTNHSSLAILAEQLLKAQTDEALRCRQENIVTSDRDANVGSVLGWGFPAHLGGVITFAQQSVLI